MHSVSRSIVGATATDADALKIGSYIFSSRLMVGTGKYSTAQIAKEAIAASGAELITVALRRRAFDSQEISITAELSPKDYIYLPNTAGCYNAAESIRTLRLAREIGGYNLVKLEVIGDKTFLYPDVVETLKAAEVLVNDGFEVMAYSNEDPIIAARLEEIGCVAVMPIAAPIGSGLGIQNKNAIRIILEQASIPIIIDAGIGTPSDVAIAMEMGCDGVLLNTAIAEAGNPALMAEAMKLATMAGRKAFLAGRMGKRMAASASSPEENMVTS
jgi:thiazole synthase